MKRKELTKTLFDDFNLKKSLSSLCFKDKIFQRGKSYTNTSRVVKQAFESLL